MNQNKFVFLVIFELILDTGLLGITILDFDKDNIEPFNISSTIVVLI